MTNVCRANHENNLQIDALKQSPQKPLGKPKVSVRESGSLGWGKSGFPLGKVIGRKMR